MASCGSSSLSTACRLPPGHRDLDAVVSELLLYIGEGFAILDEQRGEGMPEIVETDVAQASSLERLTMHAMPQIIAVNHRARLAGEDPRRHFSPTLL